jgi:hypothetical protein
MRVPIGQCPPQATGSRTEASDRIVLPREHTDRAPLPLKVAHGPPLRQGASNRLSRRRRERSNQVERCKDERGKRV